MHLEQHKEFYCNPYQHICDFKGPEDNMLQSIINMLVSNEVTTCQRDLRWLALHLDFYKGGKNPTFWTNPLGSCFNAKTPIVVNKTMVLSQHSTLNTAIGGH